MRDGWQTKTLGEILCRTESVNPAASPDVDFDYIDVSSVSNETFVIETTQRMKGKDAPSRARRLVRSRDVLFATIRPTLKRIAITPDTLDRQVGSTGYFVMRPNEEVDHRFLFYFLFTGQFMGAMAALQKGASYPAVTDAEVRAQSIMFPAICEQRRIVAILDEAVESIATAKAHAEKNLRNARELFESRLREVFSAASDSWAQVLLGDACSIARGGSPRPIKEFLTSEPEGINWVKISDATASAKYIFATAEKIKPAGVSRSRLVHDGDFLLSNSMSFGRPYIMRTTGCIHDGWLVLSNYQGTFCQDFLYLLLGSSFVYQQFDRLAAGSTVRNLNIDLASSVRLPAPPLDEQVAIAEELDELGRAINQLADVCRRKVAALDELKHSLLHQAFSGTLTQSRSARLLETVA